MFEGSQSVEQPSGDTGSTDNFQQPMQNEQSKQSALPDLDKLERFTFNGKEMTAKDLKSAYMAHSDYTAKTQALAHERRFMNNLESDLDKIRDNPALAEEFKSVYPQSYHKYLKYAMQQNRTQPEGSTGATANPEISTIKSELQQLREFQNNLQIKELESQFSNIFNSNIKTKFKWVDEDRLVGLARDAMGQYQLRDEHGRIDANVLERIAKTENDKMEKLFQDYQKTTFDKQRAANTKARDIGSGGGISGQAPKAMSWGDATKEYERRMAGSRE